MLPGFVNAHSHAFQRALRGRAEGGDFWAWRELMLELAGRQTPESVRAGYEATYAEMRAAGYTAVGEFHYLGEPEARAAVEAAGAAGIEIVLLLAAYARGGLERFRQPSVADYLHQVDGLRADGVAVGLAPHSVRACPPEWLDEIARYADRERLPLHVHADEQPREIDECVAEHSVRPIELLAGTGCLSDRTTVVHATHARDRHLHRLGLQRAHRPARGAPRARGDRAPGEREAERPLDRAAALLRRRRGRGRARARALGRRGGRPGAPVAPRPRGRRRLLGARLRLLGRGAQQRLSRPAR